MSSERPRNACVRFCDRKFQNVYVAVKDIYEAKHAKEHIKPLNVTNYNHSKKYYVMHRPCRGDDKCLNAKSKKECCKRKAVFILCLGSKYIHIFIHMINDDFY